jgi:2-polyprenyl-3-methyl-5-hydroxy-6-metoxy-1,4-benzoquinol methylase
MLEILKHINERPTLWGHYTADELWTDEYTSKQMLQYHLAEDLDISSRNKKFLERSAKWIVEKFDLNSAKTVADFGCGPGLYTSVLVKSGAAVTGIDFNEVAINYAKEKAIEKNLKIDYSVANYLEYETKLKFDLITLIFCDFCALNPEQRQTMLKKFREALHENGRLLLDVFSLNTYNNKNELATYEKNSLFGFWSPNEYYGFLNTFKYDEEKVVLDKHTIIEEKKTKVIYNWLKHYSLEEITRELEEAGFMVEEVFSNVAGDKYNEDSLEIAIVAK